MLLEELYRRIERSHSRKEDESKEGEVILRRLKELGDPAQPVSSEDQKTQTSGSK